MKNYFSFFCRVPVLACLFMLTAISFRIAADPLTDLIQTRLQGNAKATQSQNKIDQLSDETRRMLDEYRQNLREAKTLKAYNDYLAQLVDSQVQEKRSLEKQMLEVDVTQREIVPLMLRMLEYLDAFVGFDLPFLPEERQARLKRLKDLMIRADVTTAEKFRQVLEAYQIESDYGRTIEAYRADLVIENLERPVDFLRLGRVALYYRSLDGGETGIWNQATKSWDNISGEYTKAIRDGLRIARKEAAPDLLTLPIPAPEAVK